MKKGLTKVLAGAMAVMLMGSVITGCSSKTEEQTPQTPDTTSQAPESTPTDDSSAQKPAGEAVNLSFSTQDVGTSMYVYASAMTQIFQNALPEGSKIDVSTTSPGGVGAPVIVENGECDITLGNAAPAKWAAEDGILGNPPTTKVRSIAGGLSADFVNVLFTKTFVDKTGITTVEQLVEQKYPVRIAIKKAGSFGEMSGEKLLEVLGVDFETIKSWGGEVTQTGSDAIVSLLKDGKADMTIDHIAAGQSATTELCMTADMFFPQLSDDTIKKMNDIGYNNVTIPANTWKGQETEIQSVGSPQVILVSADISDDTAYAMTKAICENKSELINASAALEIFDPETASDPLKCGVELHPGAKKYYEEKGWLK